MRSILGFCLLLCIGPLCFGPAAALADTGWIASAKSCDEFAVGVLKVYSSVQGPNLNPEQQEDVRAVLVAACGGSFDHCHFKICAPAGAAHENPGASAETTSNPESSSSPRPAAETPDANIAVTEPAATPLPAEGVPSDPFATEPAALEPPTLKVTETPTASPAPTEFPHFEPPTATDYPEPASTPEPSPVPKSDIGPSGTVEAFPTDTPEAAQTATPLPVTLPWVKENMTCPGFLAQLKSRYAVSGHRMSPTQKAELGLALQIACGEKFRHCDFEACRSAPKPAAAGTTAPPADVAQ